MGDGDGDGPVSMIRGLSAAAMLLLGATAASAALCNSGGAAAPRHEIRLLFGYSPDSPTLIGTATDRRFALAEIGYSYRCWAWGATSLSYSVAAAPAAGTSGRGTQRRSDCFDAADSDRRAGCDEIEFSVRYRRGFAVERAAGCGATASPGG